MTSWFLIQIKEACWYCIDNWLHSFDEVLWHTSEIVSENLCIGKCSDRKISCLPLLNYLSFVMAVLSISFAQYMPKIYNVHLRVKAYHKHHRSHPHLYLSERNYLHCRNYLKNNNHESSKLNFDLYCMYWTNKH